jgi:hypothetical protein
VVTDYATVQNILGDAVQAYQPDLNVYYYVPRSLVPPAAIIKPQAHKTIDYRVDHGDGQLAQWYFLIMLVIGQIVEEEAQEEAGALISPGSSLIKSVNSIQFPGGRGRGYAKVVEGAVSEMMFGEGLYTYAQLTVSIIA